MECEGDVRVREVMPVNRQGELHGLAEETAGGAQRTLVESTKTAGTSPAAPKRQCNPSPTGARLEPVTSTVARGAPFEGARSEKGGSTLFTLGGNSA
eukprot:CAMPEP_0179979000 /NCGR_PEP_ID=MMETSP0983-20121128/41062_1 /TAXON_ID=483367 /ORGANISM="non described non described, Strain CCMP 2436" /LENGTH=96 /DNA_ID=CAMNT_0021896631 /DNA_START=88 /DNA_END=375 /DNA_ORIENTATION=+